LTKVSADQLKLEIQRWKRLRSEPNSAGEIWKAPFDRSWKYLFATGSPDNDFDLSLRGSLRRHRVLAKELQHSQDRIAAFAFDNPAEPSPPRHFKKMRKRDPTEVLPAR
jgi:hypothetical protein